MRTLILYDSKYGNTAQLASSMAGAIGESADVVDCEHFELHMLEGVELLVIGCPTQRWTASPLARDAAKIISESVSAGSLKVATFDTVFAGPWSGSGAHALAKVMREMGFELVAEPEHFVVEHIHGPLGDHEVERAAHWAKLIAA